MQLLGLLTAFLTFLSFASAVTPGACSGDCNVHDPAVIRRTSDGTYFRFSTGNRITVATASSLSGPWTNRGQAIPAGSIINLDGRYDLWAPDVAKVGDYYYLYYSVSTFGVQNSAIGVARSTTMDVGSWTDLGATGISSSSGSAYNAIDANLIATGGNYYVTFGSFWSDLYQVKMANPPVKTAGSSAYQVAYNSSGAHALEGPTVFERSGYFYLFFSSGTCCGYDSSRPAAGNEYRINVCRSTSVTGSYVDASGKSCTASGGTTVLQSQGWLYGPGGQGVFADTNSGGTILYYHYVDTRIGYGDGQKRFGWNILNWSNGWPVAA